MMLKRFALWGLLIGVALSASGCFLRFVLGAEVVESLSAQVDRVISAVETNATTAVCKTDTFTGAVECRYVVSTGPDGLLGDTSSTAQLESEFGLFGVIIDPLVLEMPATVTSIAGTFDDGAGHSGALVIHAKLSFVPVDDTRTIAAGPGKQLVIVDLPDGVPVNGVTFQYRLTFEQQVPAGTGPTSLKALLTGKLEVGGKTFYPPMVPCTTDLSTVTPITLPRSVTLLPLSVPTGISGCANQTYAYFRAPDVCDLDNDHAVTRKDLDLIRAMVGATIAAGDPRDVNDDGKVNADDVQACAARCTGPGCASGGPSGKPIGGEAYNFDRVDRGFARVIGRFSSSAPLDLGARGITATLVDPLLQTHGRELVGALPVTVTPRTRSSRATVFETMIGQTLYRLVVRTCIPSKEACPNAAGLDAGEYEFRIEATNALVHAPAGCGTPASPVTLGMTTHFRIDDGIHPPVDVVVPDTPWTCTFLKNRVIAIRAQ